MYFLDTPNRFSNINKFNNYVLNKCNLTKKEYERKRIQIIK